MTFLRSRRHRRVPLQRVGYSSSYRGPTFLTGRRAGTGVTPRPPTPTPPGPTPVPPGPRPIPPGPIPRPGPWNPPVPRPTPTPRPGPTPDPLSRKFPWAGVGTASALAAIAARRYFRPDLRPRIGRHVAMRDLSRRPAAGSYSFPRAPRMPTELERHPLYARGRFFTPRAREPLTIQHVDADGNLVDAPEEAGLLPDAIPAFDYAGDVALVGGDFLADLATGGIAVLVTVAFWVVSKLITGFVTPRVAAARALQADNLSDALALSGLGGLSAGTALTDAILTQFDKYSALFASGNNNAQLPIPLWMLQALTTDLPNTAALLQQHSPQIYAWLNHLASQPSPVQRFVYTNFMTAHGFAWNDPYTSGAFNIPSGDVGDVISSSGNFSIPSSFGTAPTSPTSYVMYGSGSNQYWFDAYGNAFRPPMPPSQYQFYPCPSPGDFDPAQLAAYFASHPGVMGPVSEFYSMPGTTSGSAVTAFAAPGSQFANVSKGVDVYGNPVFDRPQLPANISDVSRQVLTGLLANTSGPRLAVRPRVPSNLTKSAKYKRPYVFSNTVRK